jgi:hypothetical protein
MKQNHTSIFAWNNEVAIITAIKENQICTSTLHQHNITYFESGKKEEKGQGMKQVTLKIYKILLLGMLLSDAYPSFLLKTLSSWQR